MHNLLLPILRLFKILSQESDSHYKRISRNKTLHPVKSEIHVSLNLMNIESVWDSFHLLWVTR